MFCRLSPESGYRRFFSPISRSDVFQASILRVDRYDRQAIAAVEGGEIVGVAQYARLPGAKEAILAIVVADAWQRQGLGVRLRKGSTRSPSKSKATTSALCACSSGWRLTRASLFPAPSARASSPYRR